MAETKEEQFARLHAKFGKKPAAEDKSDDGKDSKDDGKTKGSKRGRPKKTNADRHQDEIDTGRRTAGRSGTGDFLGGGSKGAAKPKPKSSGVQAEKPKPDPTKLANKVMADAPPRPFVGPMPPPGFTPPLSPPVDNGRQQTLTKVLAASGNPAGGLGMSPPTPGATGGLVMSPPTPGAISPFGGSGLRPLPDINFERDVAPPGLGARPAGVGMQTAGAATAPTKVKTVSISPPSISATKPVDQSKAGTGEAKGKTMKAKPKSTKDRLADQIDREDKVGGVNDYYEQLKRGGFNLSK